MSANYVFDGDKIEPVNDNDDPWIFNLDGFVMSEIGKYDNPAEIILAAKTRKPWTRVMPYAFNVPDWLHTTNGRGEITGYRTSDPNLYPEIAESIFASLVYMKVNHGILIDTVDLLNEPEIKSYFGSNKNQTSRNYISNVVPALKTIIANNPQFGVIVPKIVAPSYVNLEKSADWAADCGASERTLARRFVAETGMTFGHWRERLRLMAAIPKLVDGQPVTRVALDLGYRSPSAFIAMFRRNLGTTPIGFCRSPGSAPASDP